MIKCDKMFHQELREVAMEQRADSSAMLPGKCSIFSPTAAPCDLWKFSSNGGSEKKDPSGGSDGSFALSVRLLQVFSATFQSSGKRKLAQAKSQ